ncbi:c-type cytochrome [Paracoccus beibuensis]|uniref:c-type cytochrome n=1 Tax=Paracoccus beibuensis TaxID=547602 RepID=UPI0022404312|nr:cytochrome c [Paracoccus beibuensis]
MRQIALAAAIAVTGAAALAQSPEDAVEGRHGFMTMLSIEMGALAGMAKGEVPYDEAMATAAARNLMALASYDAPKLFVEGTSSEDLDDSDALPAIWQDREDFEAQFAALQEAAQGIDQQVTGGQESLGPVVQKLGVTCRDCHDSYRLDR